MIEYTTQNNECENTYTLNKLRAPESRIILDMSQG